MAGRRAGKAVPGTVWIVARLGSIAPDLGTPFRVSPDCSDGTRIPITSFREHIAIGDCGDLSRLLPTRLHGALRTLENRVLIDVSTDRSGGCPAHLSIASCGFRSPDLEPAYSSSRMVPGIPAGITTSSSVTDRRFISGTIAIAITAPMIATKPSP